MQDVLKLRANAKVNISLDVVGVREADGYHLMDMVNRSVSLCDELTLTRTPGKEFSITSNVRFLPTGEKNLVWKAAAKLCAAVGAPLPQLHCHVVKRIPTQAGLGGGSADAAAALVGINKLCGFGLSTEQLLPIAEQVGADVPFCLVGGCARVQGIGEVITPIAERARYTMVIAMPRSGNSTKEVFALVDGAAQLQRPDSDAVQTALQNGDLKGVCAAAANVFEPLVGGEQTERLTATMREQGALYAALTGTGAAVFGIYANYKTALACRTVLREQGYGAWVAQPTACGVDILPAQE